MQMGLGHRNHSIIGKLGFSFFGVFTLSLTLSMKIVRIILGGKAAIGVRDSTFCRKNISRKDNLTRSKNVITLQ